MLASDSNISVSSASGRYQQLTSIREHYLRRGRECAKITIPGLLPREGHVSSDSFETPHQGAGSWGVNSLASKLLLTLFPPNSPHFKMEIDELTLERITQQKGMKAEVDKALNQFVRVVMGAIEGRAVRVDIFEALKQLLVVGNVLIYLPPSGGIRVFNLTKYVVKRDPSGNVLEIIIKETRVKNTLPAEVLQSISRNNLNSSDNTMTSTELNTVDVYTRVYLEGAFYITYQEIDGVIIKGTEGNFPKDKTPWIVLRGVKVDGEDYGRSHVEEYFGDLFTLETLTKALNDAASLAALVKFLVRPGSLTSIAQLTKAKNGGFVRGNADDISVLQLNKYADLQTVKERAADLEKRLSYIFLMNTAIQRPGERVTAEEIRYMAQEIENTLGGLYSLMSQELQLPFTRCLIHQLEQQALLPELPKEITPVIVAGMDAIGRGQDYHKLTTFIGSLSPSPQAMEYVKWGNYVQRVGNSLGMDMDGLIMTEEEMQQIQEMRQQQEMMASLGPNAINQAGGMMKQAMENDTGQTE